MRTMRRLTPLVALAVCCAGVVAGVAHAPAHARAEATPTVPLSLAATSPSGVQVYEIESPSGFGTIPYWVNGTRTPDYNPWHMQIVRPDGSVSPFFNFTTLTADGSSWAQGDGIVYAGGPTGSVESPGVAGYEEPLTIAWQETFAGTSGWLVVAWANQAGPISFELHFPPGSKATPVAAAPLQAYELKDFEDGVRAGAPAGAVVSVGDALGLDPAGGQLWGYLFYLRSTAFGRGNLTFDRAGDGLHRALPLDATADPASGSTCVCFEWGRWVFTSGSEVDVGFDYVGDGRRTAVYVVAATLPPGTLPGNVWREFDLGPP